MVHSTIESIGCQAFNTSSTVKSVRRTCKCVYDVRNRKLEIYRKYDTAHGSYKCLLSNTPCTVVLVHRYITVLYASTCFMHIKRGTCFLLHNFFANVTTTMSVTILYIFFLFVFNEFHYINNSCKSIADLLIATVQKEKGN